MCHQCLQRPDIRKICHKCLQHPCKCVNLHQTIYMWNTHVRYKTLFRSVPWCAHQVCIGSPLNNFTQHLHDKLAEKWSKTLFLDSFTRILQNCPILNKICTGVVIFSFLYHETFFGMVALKLTILIFSSSKDGEFGNILKFYF